MRRDIGFFLFPFPMVMVVTNRKFPLRVLHSADTLIKPAFGLSKKADSASPSRR